MRTIVLALALVTAMLPTSAALPCVVPVPVVCAQVIGPTTVGSGQTLTLGGDAYVLVAQIRVQPGGTLILGGGDFTFAGASATVGIEVRDNGTLRIQGGLLEGPREAGFVEPIVNAFAGSILDVQGAVFRDVRLDVRTNRFVVEGNTFHGRQSVNLYSLDATFQNNAFVDSEYGINVNSGSVALVGNECTATGDPSTPQSQHCVISFDADVRVRDHTCLGDDAADMYCLEVQFGDLDAAAVTCQACFRGFAVFDGSGSMDASSLRDRADPTSVGGLVSNSAFTLTNTDVFDFGTGVICSMGGTLSQSGNDYSGTTTPTNGC